MSPKNETWETDPCRCRIRCSLLLLAVLLFSCVLLAGSAAAYSGGGSLGNPYLINTEADLRQLSSDVSGGNTYSGTYFQMNNDTRLTQEFTPIGKGGSNKFSGTFDGNGHVISNLNIGDMSLEHAGLFGNTNGATIRNLGVEVMKVSASSGPDASSGGISWGHMPLGSISNCYVAGPGSIISSSSSSSSSGIVGTSFGTIVENSVVLVQTVGSGSSNTGRIVGYGSSSNCFAWSGMQPASGSTFRSESYTTFTLADVMNPAKWTATNPGLSTSVWGWDGDCYVLPSQKTAPGTWQYLPSPSPFRKPVLTHVSWSLPRPSSMIRWQRCSLLVVRSPR